MGGGNFPGPQTGQQSSPNPGVTAALGAGKPGPIAAKQGVRQNLSLTGWPRDIEWNEFRDLAQRPSGQNEDAQINPMTHPADSRTVRERGQWKLAELELQIIVNRADSWVVQAQKSSALKAHEQGHFDIHGIIVGRDLVEALKRLRARNNEGLGRAVSRTMQRQQQRAQSMTDAYDEDTRHGTNATRQAAWETQIRRAIDNNATLRAPN